MRFDTVASFPGNLEFLPSIIVKKLMHLSRYFSAVLLTLLSFLISTPSYAVTAACTQLAADWSAGQTAGPGVILQPTYSGFAADEEIYYTLTTTGSSVAELNTAYPGDFNGAVGGIASNSVTLIELRPYGGNEVNTSGTISLDSTETYYFFVQGTNNSGSSGTTTMVAGCRQVSAGAAPVANAVSATVAANSSNNAITLNITGGAATSVAVSGQASHGTATASGTSITYTPAAGYSGSDSFTYTATNASGTSSPANVTVTVSAPTLAFTPAPGALTGGTVNVAYSQTISVSGGNGPYSYSATGLPAGLSINASTGAVTGTPTTAGSYNVTVNVTDANGATGSASYTIAIANQAPVANAVSITVAANSSNNPVTLNVTGGAATSVAVGSTPSHGTASASGTSITYTPTAGYSGADSFTYTATNSAGTSTAATVTVTVSVPTLTLSPSPGALPGGTVGTAYSQSISASGGTGPYTYSASGLPPGLTMNAGGAITGTPTTAGSYTVTVNTTDANSATGTGSYTIVVSAQAPVANAVSTTVAANSTNNSITLNITGGAATSVAVASTPTHGSATASGTAITYTPTAGYSGSDSFTYTATNASGTSTAATVTVTVTAPTLVFSPATGALPGGTVGTAYSQSITASGGSGPYNYTATGLPPGLSINTSTGAITGTPTTNGSYSVTVNTTDANGVTGSVAYTIAVGAQAPVANAVSATVAANSTNNLVTLSITGGSATSVAVASTPSHGTATASGTTIRYTPAAGYSGADSFTYTATNGSGTSTAATVSITVSAPTLVLSPAPGALPAGTVGTSYSQSVSASGGTGPYSYTSSGLPPGLTINASTGAITGTPTTAGSYNVTVNTSDANGATGTASYTIAISVQAPVANAVSLTVATNSINNTVTLSITGGAATSVAVASSPTNGTAAASGTSITYTPNSGYFGADSFTYTATNAAGTSIAATVSVTVTATPLTFSPAPGALAGGTVGTAYSQTVSVTGGVGPYSYAATGLPAGLSINTSTGAITGTPTTAGSYTVNVTATAANNATSSATYTIAVAAQAPIANAVTLTVAANSTNNAVTLNITGGTATSVTVASAPSHGTASASGATIRYTPAAGYSGQDSFTYTATNAAGTSTAATVTITVSAPSLVLTPASGALPGGTVGISYSQSVSASGGTGPYGYTATGLPPGLSINASTGAIVGTPTAAGSFTVTVNTTDANGATGTASYTIAVGVQAPVANAVSITVTANSTNNAVTLNITGGAATSVAVLAAPAHGTAVVSGLSIRYTPTAGYSGSDTFTYTATNAAGTSTAATVTVTVSVPTLTLSPAAGALSGGTVGTSYNQAISTSGGTGPYSYSATGLPPGLSINSSTGTISGTPTAIGSYSVTVTVSGANGATGTAAYTIVVGAQAPVTNAVAVTVAANSNNNTVPLNITGGAATAVAVGTAPQHGTAVASGTSITYTPTAGYSGTDTFTYTATNSSGTSTAATVTVTVSVPTLVFTPTSGALPAGVASSPYSQAISIAGGTAPYGYTATGLPAGLSINSSTGTITGTPIATGSYTVVVKVVDANGVSGTASYSLNVTIAPPVVRSTSATVPANTAAQAGENVSVNLSSLVTGEYDDIRIVTQPRNGTVTTQISGGRVIAIYTPNSGFVGQDSFQFVAAGKGGVSAPATASIEIVGRVPTVRAIDISGADNQTVVVNLTEGVNDGPFTAASIVNISPADKAQARIIESGSGAQRSFSLEIVPATHFNGQIKVSYTLSNAYGTSAPGMVTMNVTARPDPTADATVRAISDAQAEFARRTSRAQVSNFLQRTESLHGIKCNHSSYGLRLNSADPRVAQRMPGQLYEPEVKDMPYQEGREVAQIRSDRLEGMAHSTPQCGTFGIWTGGTVDSGTRDAITGRAKTKATTTDISVGIDATVSPGLTIGAGVGIGSDSTDIAVDRGHVSGDSKAIAVYASYAPLRGAFIDGVVTRGWLDFDTRRLVADNILRASGGRKGHYTTGAVSVGIDRESGAVQWSLYGRAEYMSGSLDSYREYGANRYDLRFDSRDVDSKTGALGFKVAYKKPIAYGLLSLRLRGEWLHEFADGTAQGLDYADLLGPSYYSIDAQGWSRNQYILAPGIGILLNSGWDLSIDLGGRAASGERSMTTNIRVKKKF